MHTSFQKLLSFVFVTTLLLSPVMAPVASAADPTSPAEILRVADDAVVTRGDFIRAAVRVLDLPLEKGRKTLPYKDVPSTLRQYIQKAHTLGALKMFGNDLQPGKTITRGEAIVVLTLLTNETAKNAKFSYTDVRGTDMERAVGLALEKDWMKANNARTFGVAQPLKGKEAKLLLARVQRGLTSPGVETITVPIIRIGNGNGRSLPKEDVLRAVWSLLNEGYIYQEKLDGNKAMEKAIQAFVDTLNDPYTTYLPKQANQRYQDQIRGEIEGIGATVEQTGGVIVVISPIKGSPAEKAGLQPKDQILSANDEPLTGLSLDDAISKIRGPKGSTVKLHINRSGYEFDVSITRAKVTIPEVEISNQNGISIVKIFQFGKTTETLLRPKMIELQAQNPRGVILDLRNNPGGLLDAASTVVSLFLPKGSPYAKILARDSTTTQITHEEPVIAAAMPVVVLVNEGSASASEIVAGALQDAGRARIVGKKTFGKGTVQQLVEFNDDSSLKLTIAEWQTPKGRKIDGTGVEPDIVVEKSVGDRDEQLLKAIELIR